MSNPTEITNVVPSDVDNDDAEDQQPADGEEEDDPSNQKSQPSGNNNEQNSAVGENCDEKETTMRNQTPDHRTLLTSIFADTNP